MGSCQEKTEFITTVELCRRLHMAKQTIYNKIYTGEFIRNHHFYKPSPKKILFIWSEILKWLEGEEDSSPISVNNLNSKHKINAAEKNDVVKSQNQICI